MNSRSRLLSLVAVAGTLAAMGPTAVAQENKIVLRVADYIPPSHYFIRYATKPWIESVTKKSNGRIEIKHFPSEQLGKAKDLLSLTQSGVADMAGIVPSFVSDRMPLGTITELPGQYRSSCHGTAAIGELMQNNGILVKEELDPNDVVAIFAIATAPYMLFSRRDRLSSLDDIKGLKVRTVGGVMGQTFEKLEGVGVQMASPEIYESLSRGTVDGLAYTNSALVSNGFHKLTKSALDDAGFGGGTFAYFMSKKRWNAMPPDMQEILLSAGRDAMKIACQEIDKEEQEAKQKGREAGIKFFAPSTADKARLSKVMDDVANDWVRDATRRGKPADAVYKAFRNALAKPVAK